MDMFKVMGAFIFVMAALIIASIFGFDFSEWLRALDIPGLPPAPPASEVIKFIL